MVNIIVRFEKNKQGTLTKSALQNILTNRRQILTTRSDTPMSTQLRYKNVFCTPHISHLPCFNNSSTADQYRLPLTPKPRNNTTTKVSFTSVPCRYSCCTRHYLHLLLLARTINHSHLPTLTESGRFIDPVARYF